MGDLKTAVNGSMYLFVFILFLFNIFTLIHLVFNALFLIFADISEDIYFRLLFSVSIVLSS